MPTLPPISLNDVEPGTHTSWTFASRLNALLPLARAGRNIITYNDVAGVLADTSPGLAEGTRLLTAQGHAYQVAASNTPVVNGYPLANAGGAKLYVLTDAQGRLPLKAFGALGDGTTDDTAALQRAIDAAAAAKVPLSVPAGTYRVTASLVLPRSDTDAGTRSVVAIHGSNTFDTSGPDGDVQCKIRCEAAALFVGSTLGTVAAPTKVRLDFRNIGFFATNSAAVCFDLLNFQFTTINRCWFRGFSTVIRGKAGVLTRITENSFLNVTVSVWDNTMLTGGERSSSDFWFNDNYINGSLASTTTKLINLYYAAYCWFRGNFIDFGVVGLTIESGESITIEGNQFDYCPTALQLKALNYVSVRGNRFNRIRKADATQWSAPTAAMTDNNWKCIELLIGAKNIDLDGNLFIGSDKEVLMPQSGYSVIRERGSIKAGATPGSMVDMTGRTVGAAPDGEGFEFANYELQSFTTLPVAPATSYPGHKFYFYNALVRNVGGVWLDGSGARTFGKPDLIGNGDFSSSTGWTFGASEAISGGQLVITGNNFTAFWKTLTTQTPGTYLAVFEFTTRSSGSIRLQNQLGTTTDQQSAYGFGSVGVHYWQFTATTNFDRLNFVGSNLTATMDNVFLVKLA